MGLVAGERMVRDQNLTARLAARVAVSLVPNSSDDEAWWVTPTICIFNTKQSTKLSSYMYSILIVGEITLVIFAVDYLVQL